MSRTKTELIQFRVKRSKECFEDSIILSGKKRWNSAANRLYYAGFYAVSAYTVQKELKITTHSGLKSFFNKELIKSGNLNLIHGKVYNNLFAIRQEADYEDFVLVHEEEIQLLLPQVEELIHEIFRIIEIGK